jgi:hypothetical protein
MDSAVKGSRVNQRALQALGHVLPPSIEVRGSDDLVAVNGRSLRIKWIGEGWLADVRRALEHDSEIPDIVVARRMSPGAKQALDEASISWIDETGAAEISLGSIIVSKSGRPKRAEERIKTWTPSVLGVAEALLCGVEATVATTEETTGLSTGSCTNALRFLAEEGLLVSEAKRGPRSARRIADFDKFLEAYAAAVAEEVSSRVLSVGVIWRDFASGLSKTGAKWDELQVSWACTGTLAASVLAPHMTTFGSVDVYLDVDSLAGLESAALNVGLDPIEGGRLRLRPFPTVTSLRLSTRNQDLRTAPWPRVYADLRLIGVRGEEAAEHLREVARAE